MVVAAATIVGLLIFEIGARLLLGPPAVHFLTPGRRERHADFDVTYGVDRRGRRWTCPPPDAPRRTVAIIGDSFAFGQGVSDRDHFVARLSCRMSGTEVLSLGSVGQDFLYYELALHSLVPSDADDIVLLLFENDVPPGDWEHASWKLLRTLYRVSHAVQVLRRAKRALEVPLHREGLAAFLVDGWANNVKAVALTDAAYFEDLVRPPPDRLDLFDRAVRRFVGDAREIAPRARLFLAMAPEASTLSYQHREFYRSLADVPLPPPGQPSILYRRAQAVCAAAAHCSFIDLYPVLSRDGESLYFPHDFHWNASGHARVADAVSAALATVAR